MMTRGCHFCVQLQKGKRQREVMKGNHPKSTVLFKFFALPYFAGKKAMFNLNENNRIVMSQHPSDMRIGVN
ncbi:MAG: hypothetical protein PUF27_06500, partial [Bacteroidales bacterium]|nr:hypothetical protein [Bacteroidales bacterium]